MVSGGWLDGEWLFKLRRGQGPPSQPVRLLNLRGCSNLQRLLNVRGWLDGEWLSKLRRGQGPPSQPVRLLNLRGYST